MHAFAVVIALLAAAGLGWLLSRAARRALRRRGVPVDERDADGGHEVSGGKSVDGEFPVGEADPEKQPRR